MHFAHQVFKVQDPREMTHQFLLPVTAQHPDNVQVTREAGEQADLVSQALLGLGGKHYLVSSPTPTPTYTPVSDPTPTHHPLFHTIHSLESHKAMFGVLGQVNLGSIRKC